MCVCVLSRECLNLSCLPKPSFADMACRRHVGDMSSLHGDIACQLECLNNMTFDDVRGFPTCRNFVIVV